MLYAPAAFEPLTDEPWDEARARDGIAAIDAHADVAFDPDPFWPAHAWDGWPATLPLKNLYVGAAGVVRALDRLRRGGHAETTLDPSAIATDALERRLDRGRRFAVHALAQASRPPGTRSSPASPARRSPPACLEGDPRYPVLEGNRRSY